MLTTLVSHRSISSADAELDTTNEPVIDALANWAESLGFRCEKLTVSRVSLTYWRPWARAQAA